MRKEADVIDRYWGWSGGADDDGSRSTRRMEGVGDVDVGGLVVLLVAIGMREEWEVVVVEWGEELFRRWTTKDWGRRASDGRRLDGGLSDVSKNFPSELKKGSVVVKDRRGVGTCWRERVNGGRGRGKVPSVVQAIQSLGDNLRTGSGVVKVDLANVGPVSDGESVKSEGRGRGAELGDDSEGRGH